ncbi:hypothetical protein GCM10010168_62360 [Actinoplanes ianthinogenes]|uniref:AAA+ ATPase domain-containing protein n=1 Tax=Actinoplanes ianthinogenes TaxID=122358 RepID=A0ABM7LJT0_9ACTN|nr:hypothetical protein Aiant_01730 [Actinoplanes ianthinogenes]GGR35560.1 hypothetical protein GCM10010168_62360 [Actinoplanes ianthinogenes]
MSYDDAVKLLGGDRDKWVKLLDTLLGVGMLAVVGPFRDMLGWFDAKAELSKVTERLVTGLIERRSKLSRWERTERLQAAHAVLAVTAYFEALAETKLPLSHRELALTAAEQRSLAAGGGGAAGPFAGWSAPVPGAAEPHEVFREELTDHFLQTGQRVGSFLQGLAVWERLSPREQTLVFEALAALPSRAADRYDSLLGRLAAEFPEVAFWAGMREHNATRAQLREATTALAGLRAVLDRLAEGSAPDERRAALSRAYAKVLDRPSDDVPTGLRMPPLAEAFLPQLYRVCLVAGSTPLSSENWWSLQRVRNDLLPFLTGHLTSAEAVSAPLLVLGHPGSGKSVLSKLLAGQLPASTFMPVLVPLRAVSASADLQDQIEQAIRNDTGERLEWPALSRSSGHALPVIILDGFDELLQATGVSQTDYLSRVAAFQRREMDQDRPVAVIVTSRTSVADRAQPSEGTVVVRLEPFDDHRIAAWLAVWNRTNSGRFAAGPEAPLDLATVLRYRHLAEQPLLLLMLALYDAEGNALRDAGTLRQDELYERLLARFARREVDKLGAGLPERERAQLVEAHLYRLSVVAFAMFNRGAQWVNGEDLAKDLEALPAPAMPGPVPEPRSLRARQSAVEQALDSFYFVHRAGAERDGVQLGTYEFLHATFGEFLVARLLHTIIDEMVAARRAVTFLTGGKPTDDDLLHALLCWAPLADRRQIVFFLHSMVLVKPAAYRAEWAALLVELFRAAPLPREPRGFGGYRPRRSTVPSQIAAYTANLLLLALCGEDLTAGHLFEAVDTAAIRQWQDMALFWHSQGAASGWAGLPDLVAVDRVGRAGERDVALALDGPLLEVPPVDLAWVLGADEPDPGTELTYGDVFHEIAREAHFTCDEINDVQQHALEPLLDRFGKASGVIYSAAERGQPTSMARDVLVLVGLPSEPVPARVRRYRHLVAEAVYFDFAHVRLLLHHIERDQELSALDVQEIFQDCIFKAAYREEFLSCLLAHLDPAGGVRLAAMLVELLEGHAPTDWVAVELDAAIRLAELGMVHPRLDARQARVLLERHATRRPDFNRRIRAIVAPAV